MLSILVTVPILFSHLALHQHAAMPQRVQCLSTCCWQWEKNREIYIQSYKAKCNQGIPSKSGFTLPEKPQGI